MESKRISISKELRKKVRTNDFKLSDSQRLEFEAVYLMVAHRKLSKGCTDCLRTAYKVVNNWMNFHEVKQSKATARPTKVMKVDVEAEEAVEETEELGSTATAQDILEDMEEAEELEEVTEAGLEAFSLSQLREMYPEFKSNSKAGFIKKVEAKFYGE